MSAQAPASRRRSRRSDPPVAVTDTVLCGRSGAHEVLVWGPQVRLRHCRVAVATQISSFSDGEGALHQWVGYTALGLVAIRLVGD